MRGSIPTVCDSSPPPLPAAHRELHGEEQVLVEALMQTTWEAPPPPPLPGPEMAWGGRRPAAAAGHGSSGAILRLQGGELPGTRGGGHGVGPY